MLNEWMFSGLRVPPLPLPNFMYDYNVYFCLFSELLEGNKAMYKPCSKFEGKFETQKAVFLCNDGLGHPGQFVYIRDDREEQEYFGLCEVEVFEYRSKFFWSQKQKQFDYDVSLLLGM